MHCPKCGSFSFIKSGTIQEKQRYKCSSCKCQFTQSEKQGVTLSLKMHAAYMFLNGFSMNNIAKLFDVAPPTVMRWINYFKEKLGEDFPEQKINSQKVQIKTAKEIIACSTEVIEINNHNNTTCLVLKIITKAPL